MNGRMLQERPATTRLQSTWVASVASVWKRVQLKPDDARGKFKGRVVFLGNNVKDQNWDYAVFQELSSCPATMEGTRSADCYGSIPGHNVMQADAEQAYIQASLQAHPLGSNFLAKNGPRNG